MKAQKVEEDEEKKFKNFTQRQQPSSTPFGNPSAPAEKSASKPVANGAHEEDLEIPAFIRRKMGM